MCEHETEHNKIRKNNNLMSDVYDSPAWQSFMGPCVYPNNRIGV